MVRKMENEKRLIDANALKEKLQVHHDFFVDGVGGFRYLTPKDKARVDEITNCIAEVANAPTVDAVEVVHGRWVKNGWNDYSCSACEVQFIGHGAFGWKFCPNCGAKMDGDGNDCN